MDIKTPTLAIFDLDNTLLAGDSDHAWGEFIVAKGLVESGEYRRRNDQFYSDYCEGNLDIQAYLEFALAPIAGHSPEGLAAIHGEFVQEKIDAMRLPAASALLENHRKQGHYLLIITATNSFITRPIAKILGVDDILASEAEIAEGRYTGKPVGTPCFQHGKVERLQTWLKGRSFKLEHAYFYSDSHNDIPLLDAVGNPVAVDPDTQLQQYAATEQWPVISLR